MARKLENQIMNTLAGGLVTEAGALNFPPGAATATENCIWTQKKTVKRRLGFNFELDFVPHTIAGTEFVVEFVTHGSTWTAPGNLNPAVPIRVEGIGCGQGGGAGEINAFLSGIGGEGGAGGAYAILPSVLIAPNQVVPISVDPVGPGSLVNGIYIGPNPVDTRFGVGLGPLGSDLFIAQSGHVDITGNSIGGQASACFPTAGAFSGGDGGQNNALALNGPGGGGAAGPHGNGAVGASSTPGAGGAGGGASDGGSVGIATPGGGVGGAGGAAFDLSVGGFGGGSGFGEDGGPGLHGSGGGGGRGSVVNCGVGGTGGSGIGWIQTSDAAVGGPGGGGGGGGGGTGATHGADGGPGGGYGGGGGGAGCGFTGSYTAGFGGNGGGGLLILTYQIKT